MDQGAQDIGNKRYKDEIMARTRAGMEKNTKMEALAQQFYGADGKFDDEGYAAALAQFDPVASLEYRSKLAPKAAKNPGAPVYMRSADGQYEDPYLWDEQQGKLVPADQFMGGGQSPQLGEGPLAQPQPIKGGLLGGGASQVLDQEYQGALDPQAIQSQYKGFASQFPGTQISSLTRTPERNKQVGGVPNSQHVRGTAGDFVVPQAVRADFIANARKNGFEAIDEGDHVHVELPPKRSSQVAPAPTPMASRIGRRPVKAAAAESAPKGWRYNPDGSMAPIPGGPAQVAMDARADAAEAKKAALDAKSEQKQQAADARQSAAAEASNHLIGAIDQLTASEGFNDLGTAMGDVKIGMPMVRNAAKDSHAQLKNVAGQVALATMARLKALSSTGATGFGSLTAPELNLLQNSIAALQSENISNAELRRSLKAIRDTMAKTLEWKPEAKAAPAATEGGQKRLKFNPATGKLE